MADFSLAKRGQKRMHATVTRIRLLLIICSHASLATHDIRREVSVFAALQPKTFVEKFENF